MSAFGPPPGSGDPAPPRRRASYLPPGGLGAAGALGPADGGGAAGASRRRYQVGATHKPGLIALKPLSGGDVLDGATKLVRRDAGAVLGMAALVNSVAVVPAVALVVAVLAGGTFQRSGVTRVVDSGSTVGLLLAGGIVLATAALTGLLAPTAARAVVGRGTGAAQAWRGALPVLARVLGATTVVTLVAVAPWGLTAAALALVADAPAPVVLAAVAVLGPASLSVVVALLPRVVLAGPAVALEGIGVGAGLARAWALSRGRYWPILGISVLALAVAALVFLVMQLLGLVAAGVTVQLLDLTRAQTATAMNLATPLSALVAATVVSPFLAGCVILQYVDARMRKEGLDLVLLRGASLQVGAS